MARASVRLNRSEIDRLLRGESGPVKQRVGEVARQTTNGAKQRAPVDTGKGRSSIHWDWVSRSGMVIARVSTPLDYMYWQHQGTGIYGPTGQPITPTSSDVLVFKPKGRAPQQRGNRGGRGGVVFAQSVKGVPPNPYLVEALEAVSPWPVTKNEQ